MIYQSINLLSRNSNLRSRAPRAPLKAQDPCPYKSHLLPLLFSFPSNLLHILPPSLLLSLLLNLESLSPFHPLTSPSLPLVLVSGFRTQTISSPTRSCAHTHVSANIRPVAFQTYQTTQASTLHLVLPVRLPPMSLSLSIQFRQSQPQPPPAILSNQTHARVKFE